MAMDLQPVTQPAGRSGLTNCLAASILGQEAVIKAFATGLELSLSTPPRPGRPRSFVLLLGPTGTGKTEMVLVAARYLYGFNTFLERLDLGEYQHGDAPVRLLGGPGTASSLGRALGALAARGGGFLLLDEIEKAHPSVVPILLGFDAGRVTLHDGTVHDLSRVHVVMTSNLGSAEAAQMDAAPDAAVERHILRTAERAFRPEIFARFSQRLVLRRLNGATQHEITRLLLRRELAWRGSLLRRPLLAEASVVPYLTSRGFTRDLGARPLRQTVETEVGLALLAYTRAATAPVTGIGGDRWSDALVLARTGQTLRAQPLLRSEPPTTGSRETFAP